MLQNPLQVRLEKLEPWQQITFMACLCERMYPNYAMFFRIQNLRKLESIVMFWIAFGRS